MLKIVEYIQIEIWISIQISIQIILIWWFAVFLLIIINIWNSWVHFLGFFDE